MTVKIAVIGTGSWGTALAGMLSDKGYGVVLWAYEKDVVDEIATDKTNSLYLPGYKLPEEITATGDIISAVSGCDYIICAVPAQFTRGVMDGMKGHISDNTAIISVAKGLEKGSLKTVSAIICEYAGPDVTVLSGPSFAKEVIRRRPTAVTIAGRDELLCKRLQDIFNTPFFRVYTHDDIIGVEIGGALKNVIAIAAGISDGLSLGLNARAALITRGLEEMVRLGFRMGANPRTFSGLSGLGDLILTCTANMSRNYTVGQKLGSGIKINEILDSTKSVAEGVETSLSAYELSRRVSIEMPIVESVYNVLYRGLDPARAVNDLMTRGLKKEFY